MPLPRVNFSNVNITIQQFQEIASGKYNAGEVRLATATSLDKINHRVTFKGDNKVSLSHAEVLAVKQAFVRALSGAGVGAEEVARVRAQLGLDPERPVDVELSCNADPELFFSRQLVDDSTSIYDLSVSEDGTTATLKIVKSAKMAVGTKDTNVKTHFGSVVVEEEVTVDLTAEVPTVTNVRVAQRFDDSFDLQERYLLETEPVPAPQAPAPQL